MTAEKRWFTLYTTPDSIIHIELSNTNKIEKSLGKKFHLEGKATKIMIKMAQNFRHNQTEKVQKNKWNKMFITLKAFKHSFLALKHITFFYVSLNPTAYSTLASTLIRQAPNLREIKFKACRWSETLFTKLLINLKVLKKSKMNFIFIEMYINSVSFLRQERLFYIMSLLSAYTDELFHTQTDSDTNKIAYKFFYRASDLLNRKNLQGKIYLGASKRHPEDKIGELDKFLVPLQVVIYENPWTNK